MLGDIGMVIPCLLVFQLRVLGQGVRNEGSVLPGPCPCTLGCLWLAWPFCPHSASCALGSTARRWAEAECQATAKVPLLELQGDSAERLNLDSLNYPPVDCWKAGISDPGGTEAIYWTLIVGLSLSWRSAWGAAGNNMQMLLPHPHSTSLNSGVHLHFNQFFPPASGAGKLFLPSGKGLWNGTAVPSWWSLGGQKRTAPRAQKSRVFTEYLPGDKHYKQVLRTWCHAS